MSTSAIGNAPLVQFINFSQDTKSEESIEVVSSPEKKAPFPLSIQLKNGTKSTHEIAMQNSFLNSLITGSQFPLAFCSRAYVHYLCNLFKWHQAIEKKQNELLKNQQIGCFIFKELFKSERIKNDIFTWSIFNKTAKDFLNKEDFEKVIEPIPLIYLPRK